MKNIFSKLKVFETKSLSKIFSPEKDVLNLGLGEPDFDTPDFIKKAAIDAINSGFTKYTPTVGIKELREKIAKCYNANFENVAVTLGATQGILSALSSIDIKEVLIPSPHFPTFRVSVMIAGGIPKIFRTNKDFRITPENLEKNISKKTNVLIINSPNNPTGVVYSKKELEEIAEVAREHDVWVLSDEVYEKFVYGAEHVSIHKFLEKTIVLNSFSKIYCMTGWRLGFIIAPKEVVERVSRFQMYTIASPPSFVQYAGIKALSNSEKFVREIVLKFDERRKLVMKRLDELSLPYVKPQGAFYIFPDISKVKTSSFEFCELLLEKAKVLTVPGELYGWDSNVRFSYATSKSNLIKAFDRIEKVLKQN